MSTPQIFASESTRFYTRDGQTADEVPSADGKKMVKTTITHARKLGLLPGYSNIIKRLAMPQLEAWKIENALRVSLANPIAPCSNSPVISANVTLTAGEFGAIVAQLSNTGAPTAGVYPVDVTSVGAGKQRFITVHAADAPAVSVRVVSLGKSPENAKFILQPGTVNDSSVPTRDRFAATIQAPGGATFGPYTVAGGDQSLFFLAAVGNASTGSVTVLSKLLRSVE